MGDGSIRLENVAFGYPGRPRALSRVSFHVVPHTVLALVGRSGAGKSTILKLINKMLAPIEGRILVDAADTRTWDDIQLRRRIGYVIQEGGLFPHMTIADNVGLVPRLERWPPVRTAERVRELLDLVGLPADTYAARWPHELSGGQRQRVGLARALAADPPFLLMDEPFGALDPVTRLEVRREFVRIQQTIGTTVVIVTHDMAEAFALGTTVGVLDTGSLIVCDSPAAVRASSDPRVTVFT